MEDINIRLIRSAFELAHLLNNKEAIEYLESKYGKIDYMPPKTFLKESKVKDAKFNLLWGLIFILISIANYMIMKRVILSEDDKL